MSSRNKYFTPDQRLEARGLYYALRTAREMYCSGIVSARKVEREMKAVIRAACSSAKIDYIAFTDFDTLTPVTRLTRGTVISLAVHVHGVRLIDNIKLT
jgi:pantoate--beta-alanine ligase